MNKHTRTEIEMLIKAVSLWINIQHSLKELPVLHLKEIYEILDEIILQENSFLAYCNYY